MEEGSWYIRFGARVEGPVSTATLQAMAAAGTLKSGQSVRPRLDGQWTTAGQVLREAALVSTSVKNKHPVGNPREASNRGRPASPSDLSGKPLWIRSSLVRGLAFSTAALGAIAFVIFAAWKLTRPKSDTKIAPSATVIASANPPLFSSPSPSPTLPRNSSTAPSPSDPEALFGNAAPAVFKIVVHGNDPKLAASGSGFFVGAEYAPKGYRFHPRTVARLRQSHVQGANLRVAFALTNHHVIDQSIYGDIELHDKSRGVLADVLYEDPGRDVALVTVILEVNEDPRALRLADSASINIGMKVFAIGNPLGFSNTLSDGLVSGIRTIRGNSFLQTSAPISQGSSGGPLLAQDGTVIGITTATITDGQNLNLAVRFDEVRRVMQGSAISRPLWQRVSVDEQCDLAFRLALEAVGANSATNSVASLLGELRERLARHKPIDVETFSAFQMAARSLPAAAGEPIRLLDRFIEGMLRQQDLEDKVRAGASSTEVSAAAEYAAAVTQFERALEIDPKFAPSYEGLARCHFLAGAFRKSRKAAEQLVTLVPQSPRGHHWRAVCLLESSDFAGTAKSLVAAISADTSYDGTAGLEELYLRSIGWKKLAEWCREAADSDVSSRAPILLVLSIALEREKELSGAYEAADKSVKQYALTGSHEQTQVAKQRLNHLLQRTTNK